MEPQTRNRYRRNLFAVSTSRSLQPGAASVRPATDLDRQILRAARERCERRVRWGRRSMMVGLWLAAAALVVACCVQDPLACWSLVIAAAAELGLVPYYTTLACRRLRYIMALIDLDLEEGLVEDRVVRVRRLLGLWPVFEDASARRVWFAPAGLSRLGRLCPGASLAYRFAARSRVLLSIDRGERVASDPPANRVSGAHYEFSRWGSSARHRANKTWYREADCLIWPKEGVA
jgi:hypothetical protein